MSEEGIPTNTPSQTTRSIPWARLVAEGLTILTSILLAFAIDAWWDGRTQDRLIDEQIAQLHAQMQANSEALSVGSERAGRVSDALGTLIALVGPEPEIVSADSLAEVIFQGFRIGPTALQMNALRILLGSGQFALSENDELHEQLIAFESEAEYVRASEELYWEIRLLISDHLSQIAPFAMVASRVAEERMTDFEVPVRAILTDRRLEGLSAELGIRAVNIAGRLSALGAAADSILALTAP